MSAAAPANTNPDEPKPEEPQGFLDKLGAALPIALTALATIFASMSNGALQEAMYWKSQAALDQSKVTNQWTHAGFKRDRALMMQAAAAQLLASCGYANAPFDVPVQPPKGASDADVKAHAELQKQARAWLTDRKPLQVKLPELDDDIKALRESIKSRESEAEILKKASRMDLAKITKAIDDAEKANEQADTDWDATIKAAAALVRAQSPTQPEVDPAVKATKVANATAAQAAGFELEERRYRAESRANQDIGFLYEIRTKVSSAESDKQRRKSDFLSYAMLVAQIGAVASSLALARKRKSFLWLLAAMVGIISIAVGGYAMLPSLLVIF